MNEGGTDTGESKFYLCVGECKYQVIIPSLMTFLMGSYLFAFTSHQNFEEAS